VQPRDLHLLQIFEHLPPSAVVPVAVVAAVDGTSEKTVRRNYKLVQVSDRRVGVRKRVILESQKEVA
jgi:hypothetical protein